MSGNLFEGMRSDLRGTDSDVLDAGTKGRCIATKSYPFWPINVLPNE
jgi:hypothetical protein